jgi:hypothetical protein
MHQRLLGGEVALHDRELERGEKVLRMRLDDELRPRRAPRRSDDGLGDDLGELDFGPGVKVHLWVLDRDDPARLPARAGGRAAQLHRGEANEYRQELGHGLAHIKGMDAQAGPPHVFDLEHDFFVLFAGLVPILEHARRHFVDGLT